MRRLLLVVVGSGALALRRLAPPRRRLCALASSADDGSTRPWARYSIVHEDASLVVVDKGSGLLTVPGRGEHKQDSLITRLRETHATASVAHRLDRDTSGLLVVAKTKAALRALSMAFERRDVDKAYVAAVLGAPEADFGTVSAPIGKVQTAEGYNRIAIVDEAAGGRPARTDWAVLERRDDGTTLLSLQPVTGRAQQLRVHCASLGIPILGDALHGSPDAVARAPRLCLHAARLSFAHPALGETVAFEAEAPFAASPDYASLIS